MDRDIKTFEDLQCWQHMDNAKFCSHARASCWEILDHLITAHDDNIIPSELLEKGREYIGTSIKLINGYMNYLKRSTNPKTNKK
ncbi:MAG: four helix bundle protein [Kiritimatiellae bacterium]|nr:four helix bundle protein [Kiritimatiellia bacterium]